jgi:N-acylglucosamine 2-epimerase
MLTRERLEHLRATYRDGLLQDTLGFWLGTCVDFVDLVHGGYLHQRLPDGKLLDSDKSIWPQGRTLWTLGHLYNNVEKKEAWLEAMHQGARFLDHFGTDPVDGRMWFHVARDGTPIRKRRYAFSESFAAIGYAEYARATGSDAYAAKAGLYLRKFLDHVPEPKFTGARPLQVIGKPMISLVSAQVLREAIGWEPARGVIDAAIETIERHFVKDDIRCVMEAVAPDGSLVDHVDGRTLNPGHAIEAAWFIMEEGRRRDDRRFIGLGCRMLDYMWERGWDTEFGGILYFRDVHGLPVQEYWQDMKFWWPHNETVIATLLAYELTGEDRYARWHTLVHDWSHRHFADPVHGEWYGYLRRDGAVANPTKGNLWKTLFHHPRMQIECWKITERLLARQP